ncbi:15723_t:CDS:1, partial [Acaulospora colombiana]
MPALEPQSKVLLTGMCHIISQLPSHKIDKFIGGSGFIGAWILKTLLESNLHVRAVVRSQPKADFLLERFQEHRDKLEFTIIEDITTPDAFDAAFEDGTVQGVIHAASPRPTMNPEDDPDVLIKPAVEGTLGILKSAAKFDTVKRVVITSTIFNALVPNEPTTT